MASLDGVMAELEAVGSEKARNTYARHGAQEPIFGVSFADLGIMARGIKIENPLAVELGTPAITMLASLPPRSLILLSSPRSWRTSRPATATPLLRSTPWWACSVAQSMPEPLVISGETGGGSGSLARLGDCGIHRGRHRCLVGRRAERSPGSDRS